jgi:hypothetical protein
VNNTRFTGGTEEGYGTTETGMVTAELSRGKFQEDSEV